VALTKRPILRSVAPAHSASETMNSSAARRVASSKAVLADMASMHSHACSMNGRRNSGSERSRSISAEMASRETNSSAPPDSDACSTRSRLGTSAWKPVRAAAASPASASPLSDDVISAIVPCMAATRTPLSSAREDGEEGGRGAPSGDGGALAARYGARARAGTHRRRGAPS